MFPEFADGSSGFFQLFEVARDQREFGAGFGQRERHCFAESFAGAGDDGDLVVELLCTHIHGGYTIGPAFGKEVSAPFTASTNLLDWLTRTNLPAPNSVFQLNDPTAANFPRRFFRAVQPQ